MKICKHCKKSKPLTEYGKNKQNKDGRQAMCKPCKCVVKAKYKSQTQLDNMKKWREDNKEEVQRKKREYYLENREHIKAKSAEYRKDNNEVVNDKKRAVYEENNQHRLGNKKGPVPAEFKDCPCCKETKPRTYFFKKLTSVSYLCKQCTNLHTMDRKRKVRDRTPPWADMSVIAAIYRNRPEGYHVDHIIPIFGIIDGRPVTGLHTQENLQHLPAKENLSKQNYITEADLTTHVIFPSLV